MAKEKDENMDLTPFMDELGRLLLTPNPSEEERANGFYKEKLCGTLAKMKAINSKCESARAKRFTDLTKTALELVKQPKNVLASVGKFVMGVLPEQDKMLKEQLNLMLKAKKVMEEVP